MEETSDTQVPDFNPRAISVSFLFLTWGARGIATTAEEIAEELAKPGAETDANKDIEKVVTKSEEFQPRFGAGGPLSRFVVDGELLIGMVKDACARNYRRIPFGTVAAAAFTLIYALNPLDLLPDVLPIVGQIGDAAVIAACPILIEQDLSACRHWKQTHPA